MRVSELIRKSRGPCYSFEVFPRMRKAGRSIEAIVDDMARLNPRFISVTYGAGGGNREDLVNLCDYISSRGVTPLPHFTVVGHSRRQVDEILCRYRDHRFENVLALRGDPPRDHDGSEEELYRDFSYASELIGYVKERFSPCVGAAVYPEGRPDCSWEDNLRFARIKRDAGAEFFITQLFFENDHFFRFVAESGLGRCVIPGILPIFGPRQLEMAQSLAGAHIPRRLSHRLSRYRDDPKSYRAAGLEYAAEQIEGLAEAGFDFVHIFTLNRARHTARLLAMLGDDSPRDERRLGVGDLTSRTDDLPSGEAH